jgi:hypothetical protein
MRFAILVLFLFVLAFALEPGRGYAQKADSSATPSAPGEAPVTAVPAAGAPAPPARKIPGINVADQFPKGCVDCHMNMPEQNLDTRFSTLLKGWAEKVEPGLLAKSQAATPKGVTLKGKHPVAKTALRNIPAACIKCHGVSKKAPIFKRLMHQVHLVGGDENPFMSLFQGECTHCHKMDVATGAWSVPSAPEP